MSTTKVSALANKGSLTGNEEILINDGGTSKKSTVTAVRAGVTDATKLPLAGGTMTGNIVMSGSETVDGRDVSADGTQLDTNTSAIATKAPIASPTFTGTVAIPNIANLESAVTANTAKVGITTSQANAITANTAKTTNATHTGEVTGATALTIADNVVDEANLKVSNTPTNGYFLQAQSGNTGGLTWAATSTSIADGSITTAKIADDAVTSAKIATGAVDGPALATNSVNSAELIDGAVDLSHMSDNSVDSRCYVDGSIDAPHLADNSVTTAKIAGDAITALKIADDAINSTHIEDGQILTAALAGDAVTNTKIANGAISSSGKIANNVIDSQHYVNNSVTTAAIGNDQVTADKLANSINTDIATGVTANTTANAALPKAGGTMTGNTIHNDNVKSLYGTGSDLEIYHNGSNSYIDDSGTGGLFIRSNAVQIDKYTGETMIYAASDGAVNLYHNDALKIATTAQGVTVTGTAKATTDTDTSNSGNVALNFEANQNFVLTLTGNVTLTNPSFAGASWQVGQSGFIVFKQDGTGSRTVSLGTDYETAGGSGLTLTATASASDVVPYIIAATNRILLGTPQLAFA